MLKESSTKQNIIFLRDGIVQVRLPDSWKVLEALILVDLLRCSRRANLQMLS